MNGLRRCKAVTMDRGKRVRCIGNEGHYSAHHTEEVQWPNMRGLPVSVPQPKERFTSWVIGLLVAVLVLTAAIVGLILHYKP